MEKFNEKVATNAQKNIYKMVVSTRTDDFTMVNAELTDNPITRSKQIADGWLASKALEDYDTPNAIVEEDDCYLTIFVHHLSNDFDTNLVITWDMLTDDEIELIKGVA